jgi:hypothetical protein
MESWCPDCGWPISPRDEECPDCGRDQSCPDCGCSISEHDAVNRLPDGSGDAIVHCARDGACWETRNTGFVELVREHLKGG